MRVGCIYVPQYPAWVLIRYGVASPLAVVDQGRVVAAGKKAQEAGVETDMRVGRAETLCEDLRLRPRDCALEAAVWERVERALNATTPHVERAALGRSFVRPHDEEKLKQVVKKIGARAGLAPTRIDAHLAARKAASGRMLEIADEYQTAFRQGLSVKRLVPVGVDEEVVEKLNLFGYETIGDAATLSKRHLEAQFGEAGERLYDRLHASDEPSVSVYTPPPTIDRRHRFERPQGELGSLATTLENLIEDAVSELEGQTTQRITLRLACRTEGELVTSRILREPESEASPLKSTAHTLLKNEISTESEIEEIELVLGSLRRDHGEQANLFFERPAVRKAVKNVHKRHPGILRRPVLDQDAVFAEERVHFEPVVADPSG